MRGLAVAAAVRSSELATVTGAVAEDMVSDADLGSRWWVGGGGRLLPGCAVVDDVVEADLAQSRLCSDRLAYGELLYGRATSYLGVRYPVYGRGDWRVAGGGARATGGGPRGRGAGEAREGVRERRVGQKYACEHMHDP